MNKDIKQLVEKINKLSLLETKGLINLIEKQNFEPIDLDTKNGIKVWLDKMGIENYKINKNLTVNVNGNVDLSNKYLDKIPIQFGSVKGYFDISHNDIEELEGSPIECEIFRGDGNKLINLIGSPKKCKYFNCASNNLITLDGHPIECESFYCLNNIALTKEYLDSYDFSFVKWELFTDYGYTNLIKQRGEY